MSACKKNSVEKSENGVPEWAISKYPFLSQAIDAKFLFKSDNTSNLDRSEIESSSSTEFPLRFRWDGCYRPLGICIIWGSNDEMSSDVPQIEQAGQNIANKSDIGSAKIIVQKGVVLIKPNKRNCFENATVPITEDIILPTNISKKYGFNSVVIKKGLYKMHFNKNNDNGEVYLFAETK